MRLGIIVLLLFFILLIPKRIFASAPQITASPSGTINIDEIFTLSATMSGLSKNAIYRLRVAIAQPGTTDYFGSTFDGTNWHYGSVTSGNYVAVTTDNSGSWSGDIKGKVDPEDPSFTTGSGLYDLKIGRYTQTGTTATWSDPISVTLFVPSPTPDPPTPTPTPTARPSTPTQTRVPTIVLTKQITISPTFSASSSADEDILGTESSEFLATPTPSILVAGSSGRNSSTIFLLLGSIIVLAAGGISGWLIYTKAHGRDIFYRQL